MAAAVVLAGLRSTPHVRSAHDTLVHSNVLMGLVSDLALSCDGISRCEPAVVSYAHVTRRLKTVSRGLAAEAHILLAEIATELSAYGISVGQYLAVDGSLVPAWAQQRSAFVNGKYSQAREDYLRRRAPEAGFRVYSRAYEPDVQYASAPHRRGERSWTRTRIVARKVRGYMLTCLVDIASGLVLAFDLRDASTAHEPRVLREVLLPKLFAASPNLEVAAIVGDAKYDDNSTHEHLLTHYGIPLVAARAQDALQRRGKAFTALDHPSVKGVQGDGIAICRAHGRPLAYAGLDAPRREGLRPGQPTNAARFRSRALCLVPDGCGKVSIPTRVCWSNLPYFPYTPYGRPDLFGYRVALLRRRPQAESAFSSLQVGYKEGLDGAARVRAAERTEQEALIALSFVTRALLLLSAVRRAG
jgi:hypothetical protein